MYAARRRTSVVLDTGSATAMLMPACLTTALCDTTGARPPARKEVDALARESMLTSEDELGVDLC